MLFNLPTRFYTEPEKIIVEKFYKSKVILLLGPRQVGKTTLIKLLTKKFADSLLFLNGDEADIKECLTNTTSSVFKKIVGRKKVIVIDEAQRVVNKRKRINQNYYRGDRGKTVRT